MARIQSNKKDQEKRKIAKRQEKQKRKEERKSSGSGKSFEDMIAYVDEDGQISSTPPEIKKEEVKVEDIQISIPRKSETNEVVIYKGKIEFFSQDKGYGFIKMLDTKDKYFFHISNNPVDHITEGETVNFELKRGMRGLEVVNMKIEQ